MYIVLCTAITNTRFFNHNRIFTIISKFASKILIDMSDLQSQLNEQKRKVDFNTYDMSIKELVSMISDDIINISPDYQRQFRWDAERQSLLIESLFLGIPVPSLFMATNSDGTWEVIDGVQRLSSVVNFVANTDAPVRKKIGKKTPLTLVNLGKLTEFEGKSFNDLTLSLQREFLLKPIKVITLSDKSDMLVRFDLFERLNTGGVKLTDQEIRNCIFKGEFTNFIKNLSQLPDFTNSVKLNAQQKTDGTAEELVLRFFACLYAKDAFEHSVKDFLNEFAKSASAQFNYRAAEDIFVKTFTQLNRLPYGIVKAIGKKSTSVVLFEAVSVGAAEAILSGCHEINIESFYNWVISHDFNKLITGATNSKPKFLNRIQFCFNMFINQ